MGSDTTDTISTSKLHLPLATFLSLSPSPLFFFITTWGQNIAETGHFRAAQLSYCKQ